MKGGIKFPIPAVLGHEMSGEIVHCGDDLPAYTSYSLTPGQRVVVPFILPCGVCRQCTKGREDLCDNFVLYNRVKGGLYPDGNTRLFRQDGTPVAMYSMGGLAEYCIAPANSVFPLSTETDWSDASIVGCSVFTAYGAVRHAADVRAGESVAVIGCGGVGASVIQVCKAFGAGQIIAIDVADDKLQQMKQLGATHTINAKQSTDVHAALLELTEQQGVDVAIEALGLPATFQQATQAVAKGGRAIAIGLASPGTLGQVEMNNLVRRGVRVVGSYGGRVREDMPVVVDMVERGVVDVKRGISKRYRGLEKAQQAYEDLRDGKITGRCIVEMF